MKTLLNSWLESPSYKLELQSIQSESDLEDRFHQLLPFGTAGMRGKLGAGTNRMNIHTVRLAAEGLARQIEAQGEMAKIRGVVIAYDTRHYSQPFAYETAGVLAAHGIQSYIFTESRPTPELSFAVRYLAAVAGVVITASHNPKEYNGFKVYGSDGAQLIPEHVEEISAHMAKIDDLFSISSRSYEQLIQSGLCEEILVKLDNAYNSSVQSLATVGTKSLSLVYTPLHGAGLVPTIRALRDAGFDRVHVVEEQAVQSGDFPTITYPNPEEAEAFLLAIELGEKVGADLLLATDPDADRLGVAVRVDEHYELLTGNQLGALLLNYLLETKPIQSNAAMVKTIVTSEFGAAIAEKYGVTTVNTLTGFKYIAEKIAEWTNSKEHTFIFGYEESYGYLAGDFVRDKDAVQIALLTAEMAAYYKVQGNSIYAVLQKLYEEYGYFNEALVSLTFEGAEGQEKIAAIMQQIRNNPPKQLANIEVVKVEDYSTGLVNGLPSADVVKLLLADGSWICIRPSGTEPKCKFYIGVEKSTKLASEQAIEVLKASLSDLYDI